MTNNRKNNNDRCVNWLLLSIAILVVAGAIALVAWSVITNSSTYSVASPTKEVKPETFKLTAEETVSSVSENKNYPWQIFNGKWDSVRSENLDGFLREVGAPWFVVSIASSMSSYVTIKVNGDRIKIQAVSTFKTQPENEYHVNGPETFANFNSNQYRANTTWEVGDDGVGRLIVRMSGSEDGSIKPQKVTREVVNETELRQVMEIGSVVARTWYAKAV